MSKAIVTLVDGQKYEEIAKITLPLMRNYAKKCGADLVILDNKIGLPVPHYAKLQIRNLDFENICFIDIDVLINPKAPNIFEEYSNQLAMLDEGKYAPERAMELAFYNGIFNPTKFYLESWDKRYFNTGVMLIPRKYLQYFKIPDKIQNSTGEQNFLNLLFCVEKLPIMDLDPKFNYQISLFGKQGRLGMYMLHYTVDKQNTNQLIMDAYDLGKGV